ncbi:hypothetical protein [Marinobacter sp.]|uniref:hypothetical protein n=1 Tax=Marinobacter sp. TaxID=50741 RepID=UPI003BA98A51
MRKLIFVIVALLYSGSNFADDNSIYVITNSSMPVSFYGAPSTPLMYGGTPSYNQVVSEVERGKLEAAIRDVRSSICNSVENASVKVYFTFDADAKIFGIGTSTGAGIEVNFECKSS